MIYRRRQLRRLSVAMCGLLAATGPRSPSAAGSSPPDELHPYVEAGIGNDTNVLRLDDDLSGLANRSDSSYWTLGTGIDTRLTRGIQKFGLHARVFHNDYFDLNEVDFTGGDASLTWDWAVGTLWSGALEYEFRRELRDFANQFIPRIDVKTTNRFAGSVERRLSNRMRLGVSAHLAEIGFSQADRLDLTRTGTGVSLAFDSLAGNTVSLDADYTKRESDESGGVDFTEFRIGPAVDWRITDKSRVLARLRYTQRDEEDPALSDYSGLTGRISGKWRSATDDTFDVSVWREVSSLGDEIANFALVTGVSVRPTFSVGDRISASVELGYELRDFRGEPDFVAPDLDLTERDDKVLTGALRLGWSVTDHIDLLFDYDTQYRDSNRAGRDYDYHRVQLGFRIGL